MAVVINRIPTIGEGERKTTIESFYESGNFLGSSHTVEVPLMKGILLSFVCFCEDASYVFRIYSGYGNNYISYSFTAGESYRAIVWDGYLGFPVAEVFTCRYLGVVADEAYSIRVYYETR